MAVIRNIALDKLRSEITKISCNNDKLSLLEKSREMPIFSEQQSNHVITGAYGRTDSMREIDALIQMFYLQDSTDNSPI